MEITAVATAARWQAALDRAISNALDVLVSTDGSAFVESATQPGLLYSVSRESCDCKAGQQGIPCMHRACYLAQVGELPLDSAPAGISFSGNCDRQEVRIDGELYGDVVADEWGGWVLFEGRFPHAKQHGTFCSLEEIERELAAGMPPVLPAPRKQPVTLVIGETLVAA